MPKQKTGSPSRRKPNTFRGCGPKATKADFEKVEAGLGIRLPNAFRDHYSSHNGGTPTRRFYLDADGNDYEVQSFRRIKKKAGYEPLIQETYALLVKERGLIPARLLPFASDSGGDLYCMDLNDETIWFWAADDYKKGKPESAASQIASSIREFIDGMVTENEAY